MRVYQRIQFGVSSIEILWKINRLRGPPCHAIRSVAPTGFSKSPFAFVSFLVNVNVDFSRIFEETCGQLVESQSLFASFFPSAATYKFLSHNLSLSLSLSLKLSTLPVSLSTTKRLGAALLRTLHVDPSFLSTSTLFRSHYCSILRFSFSHSHPSSSLDSSSQLSLHWVNRAKREKYVQKEREQCIQINIRSNLSRTMRMEPAQGNE